MGFEPTKPFGLHTFQACAFSRSATSLKFYNCVASCYCCVSMNQGARCMRVTQCVLHFALRAIIEKASIMFKIVPDDFGQPLVHLSVNLKTIYFSALYSFSSISFAPRANKSSASFTPSASPSFRWPLTSPCIILLPSGSPTSACRCKVSPSSMA